jgi:UDP-glucose:(heptosyl)LPS alpha-1,3-glucosyltransferase
MKIALISQSFEENKGGAEKFSIELARYLIKKGLDIKLIARKIDPPDLKNYGTEIKIPKKPPIFRILTLAYTGIYLAKKWRADRIFALMPLPEADFYWLAGGVYSNWLKIRYPNILKRAIACSFKPHLLLNSFFQKKCINLSFKVITNSELEKDIALKTFNIFPEKIIVIPNGIDLLRFNLSVKKYREEFRKKLGFTNFDKIILFVGNNFKRKGLETIIKALARLKDIQHLYLVVVGKDKTNYFIKLSKELGVRERVKFVGYVKEIEKIYGMADIFVFPSQYDSFASVVLEAMACGLPVITTETNGASMVIDSGNEGFVLNNWKDDKLLAEYIIKTLKNSEKMGLNAAQKALHYSAESCFEKYYQILIST